MKVRKLFGCRLAALYLSLSMVGCGGGGYGSSTGSGGNGGESGGENGGSGGSVVSMQGSWEVVFQSSVSPNKYTVLEMNLTQAGTHVFAGATSALLYRSTGMRPASLSLEVSEFGGQCEFYGIDEATFEATLATASSGETLTFTLTETGYLGSAVTNASVPTNGSQVSGTYSTTAGCGPEDHGTFTGYRDSAGVNDSYSGSFNAGSDAVMITVAVAAQGFGVTFSGTDNGAPFTLQGSTVGLATELNGTVGGKSVQWFAVYDPTYNVYVVFDSAAKLVGVLSEPH
jgi:hypothetical protein